MEPQGTGVRSSGAHCAYFDAAVKKTGLSTCHLRLVIARLSVVTCVVSVASMEREVPLENRPSTRWSETT